MRMSGFCYMPATRVLYDRWITHHVFPFALWQATVGAEAVN